MYFLHAINSDRQTRLLNVLGQIAMILEDKKKLQASCLRRKETHFACQIQASASQWSHCGSAGPYKTGMTVWHRLQHNSHGLYSVLRHTHK